MSISTKQFCLARHEWILLTSGSLKCNQIYNTIVWMTLELHCTPKQGIAKSIILWCFTKLIYLYDIACNMFCWFSCSEMSQILNCDQNHVNKRQRQFAVVFYDCVYSHQIGLKEYIHVVIKQ